MRQDIINTMHRPSRLIALVSSLFLVGLVLVTSGFACDTASTKGAVMSGMKMATTHAGANAKSSGGSQLPQAPCKFPWAPGGCQSMVPCSQAAVVSTAMRAALLIEPSHPRITMVAIAPPSETPAPELPPPRA